MNRMAAKLWQNQQPLRCMQSPIHASLVDPQHESQAVGESYLLTHHASSIVQPIQVTTVPAIHAAEASGEIEDSSRVGKGGWGQTKIHDVLQAKREDQGAWLWCSKDDLVIDAVRKMTKANVGSLLVFDPEKIDISPAEADKLKSASENAVVGIITERDYLTKVVVVGKQSTSTNVREIMTPQNKLMTVTPQSSVVDVMALMTANNFRHVPVVSGGNYLGMISIRDTVQVMVSEHKSEVGRLQEYIQGSY